MLTIKLLRHAICTLACTCPEIVTKSYVRSPNRVGVAAHFPTTNEHPQNVEAPMRLISSNRISETGSLSGLRPVLLFLAAAGLLTMMSMVLEPGLLLPLLAFVAMVALTRQLGLRLYHDMQSPTDWTR